jgi:hypothetical protein
MAERYVITSWFGTHGYARTDDGKEVRLHRSHFPRGVSVRVGTVVECETQEVTRIEVKQAWVVG